MKILNPRNLPEAIVNAGTPEERSPVPNRIGVTDLIGPAWQRKLKLEYDGEIVDEIENRVKLIIGTAVHYYMDSKAPEDAHTEKKLTIKVGDCEVAGIPDIHKNGKLNDYKYTSVWSYIFGKKEWEEQLNVYAYMCKKNGYEITDISIIAFFYDWEENEKKRRDDYPPYPILEIKTLLWSEEEQRDFIEKRISAHIDVVPCSPEERWRRDPTYAVMKEGRKSAMRVLPTYAEACGWVVEQGLEGDEKVTVVERLGEDRRCMKYCPVAPMCSENRYLEVLENNRLRNKEGESINEDRPG